MEAIETILDLDRMARADNYNRWVYSLFAPYLGQRVLELGGGIGNMTQFLADRERVVTVEINPLCAGWLRERFRDKSSIRVAGFDLFSPEAWDLKRERLDTALVVNVLEHIERDREFICRISMILEPFARIIFIVPVFKYLFGPIDQHVGHLRRYSRKEILTLCYDAGIEIIHALYFNLFGAIGWWINSKILKITAQSERQISLFNNIVPVVSRVERFLELPLGQSLLVIGRKGKNPGKEVCSEGSESKGGVRSIYSYRPVMHGTTEQP